MAKIVAHTRLRIKRLVITPRRGVIPPRRGGKRAGKPKADRATTKKKKKLLYAMPYSDGLLAHPIGTEGPE